MIENLILPMLSYPSCPVIICVRIEQENQSFGINICHHLANLMMPSGDPRDGFLYPILKLMVYSYMLI